MKGGENIYPLEIEERLVEHPSIDRAVVVGLQDAHYGEFPAHELLYYPDEAVQLSQKVIICCDSTCIVPQHGQPQPLMLPKGRV